jgi:hypothetical protein
VTETFPAGETTENTSLATDQTTSTTEMSTTTSTEESTTIASTEPIPSTTTPVVTTTAVTTTAATTTIARVKIGENLNFKTNRFNYNSNNGFVTLRGSALTFRYLLNLYTKIFQNFKQFSNLFYSVESFLVINLLITLISLG